METAHHALVEAKHGRFLVNPRDTYIGRSMLAYGEYSEVEWDFLSQLVPENGAVVEVGANIGTFTVPLARKVGPRGLVLAFEPQPLVFNQLAANLALNDLVSAQAINAACGADAGWTGINRIDPMREVNFGGVRFEALRNDESDVRVRVERLDDVVDLAAVDLLKIDVEGMELDVLEGAAELIVSRRPLIYVEAQHPDRSPELLSFLDEAGYKMWWHLPPLYRPDNFFANDENIWGRQFLSTNVFCAPEEAKLQVNGLREVAGEDDHPLKWRAAAGRG